jgi:transcriptional regulator with XRE-family HTH domain
MVDFRDIIREIREYTGMNQSDFAREIGRSIQSLQNYERGAPPRADVIDKLRRLAIAHGREDLAAAMGGFGVKSVFDPGETIISAPRSTAASKPPKKDGWQQMLDEVLNSGQQDVVDAVNANLTFSVGVIRQRAGKVYRKPEKKGS